MISTVPNAPNDRGKWPEADRSTMRLLIDSGAPPPQPGYGFKPAPKAKRAGWVE
jgi:hypothetical protein